MHRVPLKRSAPSPLLLHFQRLYITGTRVVTSAHSRVRRRLRAAYPAAQVELQPDAHPDTDFLHMACASRLVFGGGSFGLYAALASVGQEVRAPACTISARSGDARRAGDCIAYELALNRASSGGGGGSGRGGSRHTSPDLSRGPNWRAYAHPQCTHCPIAPALAAATMGGGKRHQNSRPEFEKQQPGVELLASRSARANNSSTRTHSLSSLLRAATTKPRG